MSGVWAVDGSLLAGINSNYGDTATIADSCADDVSNICAWYQGNNNGAEPPKLGTGPSSYCIYSNSEVDDCPAQLVPVRQFTAAYYTLYSIGWYVVVGVILSALTE